ncbi:hypothetical protein BS329_07360 [Amycolatopsis coloradensis]|uniref:DUF4365 domain-containing protein n=1 Tax=Amycolatopsis coloradensis TaxID=76021 RepID=A0A1R0KYC7_9PSEU|nr:DUF4365 domain-containing protein [Amycolatopsis coloradensis]OLZ54356.1 hypothetical protein BS329_07360 [Amycolatopsis coloradensis]
MAGVSPSRRTGRAGVNRVTELFERHHHIVQVVDGGNDFGVDMYVTFVSDFETTGYTIALQVKAGKSYQSKTGYRVPIGKHQDDWGKPNIPVVCVVHDPQNDTLHWVNATSYLRNVGRFGKKVRSITVPRAAVLDDQTLPGFVASLKSYLSERTNIIHALADLTGVGVEATDYVSHFVNEYGEVLLFQQRLGAPWAILYHSGGDGKPSVIVNFDSVKEIDFGQAAWVDEGRMVDDFLRYHDVPSRVVFSADERMWVRLCVHASTWWREAPELKNLVDAYGDGYDVEIDLRSDASIYWL